MRRSAGLVALLVLAAATNGVKADPAAPQPQTFLYEVEHPTYGKVGTYSNTVARDGNGMEVTTKLHVADKMLGIPLFHQDADRLEQWQNGRLVAFHSDTNDNGKEIDVVGKAQGDAFVIQSPLGTFTAPARVHPSNPLGLQSLKTDVMMGTKTGKIDKVVITDTGETNVTFDGRPLRLHQFFVDSDKHQVVWLDDKGIVAGFQTEEDGTRITFILKSNDQNTAAQPTATPVALLRNDR